MRRLIAWSLLAAAVLSSAACGRRAAKQNASGGSGLQPPAVSAPFDVEAVIHAARSSFKADGAGFTSDTATHRVRVTTTGLVALKPIVPATAESGMSTAIVDAPPVTGGTAATLETMLIQRRSGAPEPGGAKAALGADGSMLVQRGVVLERLRNSAQGLEQSWTFPSAPAGDGDLIVRVRVGGLSAGADTATGHHFRDAAGGPGIRYGRPTWIDAGGKATELPSRVDAGDVEITVPAALLESTRFPAELDPLISPEVSIDAPISTGAARSSVAFDGTNYLVSWVDSTTNAVYVSRVTPAGQVLDPAGIYVGADVVSYSNPEIAYGAGVYVVAWQTSSSALRAARILPNGQVLDPAGVQVAWRGFGGALAYDGAHFVITFTRGGYFASRMDPATGAVLDPDGVFVADFPGNRYWNPSIACSSATNTCLITFAGASCTSFSPNVCTGYGVEAVRINPWPPAIQVLDPAPLRIGGAGPAASTSQAQPRVASDGSTEYVVTWSDDRNGNLDIFAAPVHSSGIAGREFAVSTAQGDQRGPKIAWAGGEFLVTWSDLRSGISGEMYGARVQPGYVLDPSGIAIALGEGGRGSVATDGAGGALVVYAGSGSRVVATRVAGLSVSTLAGSGLIPTGTADLSALTSAPRNITFTGSGYLALWDSPSNGLYAQPLGLYGAPLAPPVQVTPAPSARRIASGYDGVAVLVACYEGATGDLWTVRLDPLTGLAVAPPNLLRSALNLTTASNLRLAQGQAVSLLVYTDAATSTLVGQFLLPDGTGAGSPFTIATGGFNAQVASDSSGRNFLVSYTRGVNNFTGQTDLYAAWVSDAAAVSAEFPVAIGSGDQGAYHNLVFDPARNAFVALWWDTGTNPNGDLYAGVIPPGGLGLIAPGPIPVCVGQPGARSWLGTVFDGFTSVFKWIDQRSGAPVVYAARLAPGALSTVDANGVAIVTDGVTPGTGTLTSDWFGTILHSYTDAAGAFRGRYFFDGVMTPTASAPFVSLDAPGFTVTAGSGTNNEQASAVASDGTNYLVAWRDDRLGPQSIYAVRVNAYGVILDTNVIPIPASSASLVGPAISFNGSNYLVAWADLTRGSVRAARVSPAGAVLDPLGIDLAQGMVFPTANYASLQASASSFGYLVTWTDLSMGPSRILGVRVRPEGVSPDPSPIVIADGGASYGGASFDGQRQYLVVYERGDRNSLTGDTNVYGAMFDPGTAAVGQEIAISTAPQKQIFPAVVFDGGNHVVFWRDGRNSVPAYGGSQPDVYAARVSPAGAVLDPAGIAIARGGTSRRYLGASFDGKQTLLSWEENTAPNTWTVMGSRLSPSGALVDGTPISLVSDQVASSFKGMGSNGAGTVLLAYGRIDPVTGKQRVKARTITSWAKLAVTKGGTGTGTVKSSPSGIDCGGTCAAGFDAPTSVTLTATPDAGQVFAGWRGACYGMTSQCTVTTEVAKSVIAVFGASTLPSYRLDVTTSGTGAGTVTPSIGAFTCLGSTCGTTYKAGATVTLKASPSSSTFSGWSGSCQGTGDCTLVMDGDKQLGALFDNGAPTPTALPPGLSPASGEVIGGTQVTITGSHFSPQSSVLFGTTQAAVVSVGGDSRLTVAVPPASAPGVVDVMVFNADGSTISLRSAFTYFAGVENTPVGSSVSVAAVQTTSFVPPTDLKFGGVVLPGETTIQVLPTPPEPIPSTFALVGDPSKPQFYDIQTTALYTGKIEIAVHYDARGMSPAQEAALRLIHYACPTPFTCGWEDATEVMNPHVPAYTDNDAHYYGRSSPPFQNPDTKNHILYGVTTSLSPVVVVQGTSGSGTRELLVTAYGSGSGTVSGPNIACRLSDWGNCLANVDATVPAQEVTLTASPDPGSMFKHWVGWCAGTGTCPISMDRDRVVGAVFEPDTYLLTVSGAGRGIGDVAVTGTAGCAGVTAGSVCQTSIANGVSSPVVTLTATPRAGSTFFGWVGGGCSGTGACTFTMDEPQTVYATFQPATVTFTIAGAGSGSGTVNGPAVPAPVSCANVTSGSTCATTLTNTNPAQLVTLTATPSPGSVLTGWSHCPGAATCTVAAFDLTTVTATFEPDHFPLSIYGSGAGTGTVTGTALPAAVSCTGVTEGSRCDTSITTTAPAQIVTLRAVGSPGSVFAGWSGPCSGTGTCDILMSRAQLVGARFVPASAP